MKTFIIEYIYMRKAHIHNKIKSVDRMINAFALGCGSPEREPTEGKQTLQNQ